jgi:hypothetical protein
MLVLSLAMQQLVEPETTGAYLATPDSAESLLNSHNNTLLDT